MKKNVIFRIAAVVLMCTLVTACFASSTFAKYTSNATVDGSILKVAKWSITAQGQEIAVTGDAPVITVNLFDLDNIGSHAAGDTKSLIAPGTNGKLAFDQIVNGSEVDANIVIKIKEIKNNNDIPVVLKKGETTLTEGSEIYNGTVQAGDTLAAATIGDVTWAWAFTGDDAKDTALGIAARDGEITYEVTFEIIATQLDA